MKQRKNLRRISIVITAQTLWHLRRLAVMSEYGEKDIGRCIDKIVRTYMTEGRNH